LETKNGPDVAVQRFDVVPRRHDHVGDGPAKLDLPPLPSSRGKRFLNEWVAKASADFDAVGLAA